MSGSLESHSARGAWIETNQICKEIEMEVVALREGCVDRNQKGGFD